MSRLFRKPRPAHTMTNSLRCLAAAGLLLTAGFACAKEWSQVTNPAPGRPQAIGQTSKGCLAGAVALPADGVGYHVMHLERHRNFGHPHLVDMIESIGRATARDRLGVLHVGDLSQPRGGPTPFGHRSHQTGLDVDVWFAMDSSLLGRADSLRSNLDAPSLLNRTGSGLNQMLWDDKHARVLEFASRVPRVERIFVNPHIKRELCRSTTGDRSWLRKIRPWWGHDDHFHARLSCPPDSPQCESQEPLPAGDGCDSSMDWWFRAPTTTPTPGRKAPHHIEISRMPKECQWVLMD